MPSAPSISQYSTSGLTVTLRIQANSDTTKVFVGQMWNYITHELALSTGQVAYLDVGVPEYDTDYLIQAQSENAIGQVSSIVSLTINAQSEVEPEPDPRPSYFYWNTAKQSGGTFNLTASEWNGLTNNINAVRNYKGLSSYSFSTAYSGNIFYASMFNQAKNAIDAVNPSVATPSSRSSGSIVTASALNGLVDSLNSIS